jgi:MFS superfamily sulfate permease-like transporter
MQDKTIAIIKKIIGGILTAIPLGFAVTVVQPPRLLIAFLTMAAALFALRFAHRLPQGFRPPKALWPALAVGTAAVVAMHQTAGYFDTGAAGLRMAELLASYRMFGFHPNWRTVLFSTIMMVVLITWPRKFPRFCKTVPAGFAGVVITTALNMLLNLDAARSVVPELLPAWLPFFSRLPTSALSMLLIYFAWEHVPYGRVKALFKERKALDIALFAALIGILFWFGMLWGLAGGLVWWGIWCVIDARR